MGVPPKKTILVLSSSAELSRGGQQSILLMLRFMPKQHYRFILCCMEEGPLLDEAKHLGIEVVVQPLPSLSLRNLNEMKKTLSSIKRLCREESVDIIHSEFSRGNFYYGLAARCLKIPLIWHARITLQEPFWYEFLLSCLSTKIIAVSSSVMNRFKRIPFVQSKLVLVHNAVDLDDIDDVAKTPSSFKSHLQLGGEVLVGLVGYMTSLKGQHLFVRAALDVIAKIPQVDFVCLGHADDDYRRKLTSLVAQHNAEKRILFLDFEDNVKGAIQDMDIIVNLSSTEGFSRIVIESMAMCKAMIVSDIAANRDAVIDGESGFVVSRDNHNGIVSAMIDLIESSTTRKMFGVKARERVEKYFTIQQQIKLLEKVYEEC